MEKLTLLRHAKSSWADDNLSDHDRPLNARGERDAPMMAKRLLSRGCVPDAILCSSALRTRQTAAAILSTMKLLDAQLHIIDALYLASPGDLVSAIDQADASVKHLMVIGHNPGLEVLASALNQQIPLTMPTAAVCHFVVDESAISALNESTLHLAFHDTPKSSH